MTIKEKAKELAQAIKASQEFENLQSARARVKLDPKAQDLLQELQSTQNKVVEMQQNGQAIGQDVITQLRELENQLQLNLTLKNLVEAQQKFEQLMGEVNQVLGEELK